MLLIMSCSGTKSGPDRKQTTRFDFGRSPTSATLKQAITTVLRKYNHDLQILESLIESEWRVIVPTEKQQLLGAKKVRYKVSINISDRRNLSTAELRLFVEAVFEEDEWERVEPSGDLIEFIENMQDEVKLYLSRYLPQY